MNDETDWPAAGEGEVGDPMTEEEAEAAEEALQALHLPMATDEEVAEATRQLDLGERHRQMVVELIRRRRARGGPS